MISTKNTSVVPSSHSEAPEIKLNGGPSSETVIGLSFEVLRDLALAARTRIGGEYGGEAHLRVKEELRKAA
jgi:hypothetical protein